MSADVASTDITSPVFKHDPFSVLAKLRGEAWLAATV
jgi:hypothetical protein